MSELDLYKSTGLTPAKIIELQHNYDLVRKKLHLVELNRAVNSLSMGKGAYKIGDTIYTKREYKFLISEIKKLTLYLQGFDTTYLEILENNLY